MPTPDQARIEHDRAHPRLMDLWWALQPLRSVVRFMQTGAHPDDEISGMLAALAFRDGINLSYACSTRGEGGQNDIGTEAGFDLGALRTREMEAACDILGMRMYWHCQTPEDTITDFGFSKSGTETLGRWGRDRTLARFVEIVRVDKPDIICPTFLDVPGQHGHHRAMTETAHEVMAAAADPAYLTNIPPWQVKKMYLPAWSGAGTSYDDDLPPPPATLTVRGIDRERMTGWSWERIGQQSRTFHRTQGMGRWVPMGQSRDWPLHLAESILPGPDDALWSGLSRTLRDLADASGPWAEPLRDAQNAIDTAYVAFPDFEVVAEEAANALLHIRTARAACPPEQQDEVLHRLDAKSDQLGQVLRFALGVEARVLPEKTYVAAGGSTALAVESDAGIADGIQAAWDLPKGWQIDGERLTIEPDAAPHDPYRDAYDPIAPPAPRMVLQVQANGLTAAVPVAWEEDPVILPKTRVSLPETSVLLNLTQSRRSFSVSVSGARPEGAELALDLPSGWTSQPLDTGFDVTVPRDVEAGLHTLKVLVGGSPAQTVREINYAHIAPTARAQIAEVQAATQEIAVSDGKVGYIGAGNDRVMHWLDAIGADVTELSDEDMAAPARLSAFDTIVIGIFAMRFRPGLVAAMPEIHRWTEAGGTLVTLYHRPWDNWDPDAVPPRRIEIGQPSLRWRVTDEAAAVTVMEDHPILNVPNKINPSDWDGWVKERGLYFAKSWDAAYTPLLSMSDPDEAALEGALLVADIGQGRHIHTSLILHHQMEHLVPGAFRLMANFISPRNAPELP